jgi:hypothetical protein
MRVDTDRPTANQTYSTQPAHKMLHLTLTILAALALILSSCTAKSDRAASQTLRMPSPAEVTELTKRLDIAKSQERETTPLVVAITNGQTPKGEGKNLNRVQAQASNNLDPILNGMAKTGGGTVSQTHICDGSRTPAITLSLDPPPRLGKVKMPVNNIDPNKAGFDTGTLQMAYRQQFYDLKEKLDDLDRQKQAHERKQKPKIAEFKQQLTSSFKLPRSCKVGDLAASQSRTNLLLAQQKTLLPQAKKFSVIISDKLDFYKIDKLERDADTTLILVSATKQTEKFKPDFQFESPSEAFASIERMMNYRY